MIYGFLRRGRGELVWTDLIGGTRTTGNGYPTLIVPIKRGKRAPRKALAKGVVRARDGEPAASMEGFTAVPKARISRSARDAA